jgi:hypothetical protein
MKTTTAILTAALLFGSGLSAQHGNQDHGHDAHESGQGEHAQGAHDDGSDASIIAHQLPSYPLTTCLVSGEGLTAMGEPLDMVVEGRLIRLCCKNCVKSIKKDPAKYGAMLDEAVVKAQRASYPLDTCLISGKKLGSMGDPVELVHGMRLVRLCCDGCRKGFDKEPAKYMAMIDKALIEKQLETYPLETCVVGGDKLGAMGEPVDFLYGTQLVRLCCKGCKKGFWKDPAKAVAKIDAARKKGDHAGI